MTSTRRTIGRHTRISLTSGLLLLSVASGGVDALHAQEAEAVQESTIKMESFLKGGAPDRDVVVIGDMLFRVDPGGVQAKGAAALDVRRWPGGTVYYSFDATVPPEIRERFRQAFVDWESVAPVRFVPRTTQPDYVWIVLSDGSSSFVGHVGGEQRLRISPTAPYGTYLHELGHALGLKHEHQRSDRDQFVDIVEENIQPESVGNFVQFPTDNCTPYDFGSVMHYSPTAFTANGGPTILPRPAYADRVEAMGQRERLTGLDGQAIAVLYGDEECALPTALGGPPTEFPMPLRHVEAQALVVDDEWPREGIQSEWRAELLIRTLAHDDLQWVVPMTTAKGFYRQGWDTDSIFPWSSIRRRAEEGMRITSLEWHDGLWSLVSERQTGMTAQEVVSDFTMPREGIREWWNQGYQITELVRGPQRWWAVMSQNAPHGIQSWMTRTEFPHVELRERAADGYFVTSLEYGDGVWALVLSQGMGWREQVVHLQTGFPRGFIESRWEEGYELTELAFGAGSWAVVMTR